MFCGDHSADCGCFKPEIQYPEERLKRVPLGLMAIAWALSVYTGYHGDPLAKSTHTAKVLTGQLGWYQVVVSILSFHCQLLAFTGHSIPTTSEISIITQTTVISCRFCHNARMPCHNFTAYFSYKI